MIDLSRKLQYSVSDSMALSDLQIGALVEKYIRERDRFEKMADAVGGQLSAQLRASVIQHMITFRAKDPQSLRGKLLREREKLSYDDVEREFNPTLIDLAGVRILLYRPQDIDPTTRLVEQIFVVGTEMRFCKDFTSPKAYCARHRVVALREDTLAADPTLSNLAGVLCEVQVVTLADHIWNELEHDIRYKTPSGLPNDEQKSLLTVLRGQLDAARDTVGTLMEATARRMSQNITVLESPEELRRALESRVGRALSGDFGRLFILLSSTHRELKPALLDKLPIGNADLARGASLAKLALDKDDESDDVMAIVGALWSSYGEDFADIAKTWRGRRSALARLIQVLSESARQGS